MTTTPTTTQLTTTHLSGLSGADVEALGRELDGIRDRVLAARGDSDARYIHRIVALQRGLEACGRGSLLVSVLPPAWLAGTTMLALAKILENMEIGHNVLHGQWDWMRDPEIHSTTWQWDFVTPSEAWKHTHNNVHHTWTNVVGRDRDVGYTILRMSDDQSWRPWHLAQPLSTMINAALFEWGIAFFDLELDAVRTGKKSKRKLVADVGGLLAKATKQMAKDYLLFPLLSGPSALPTLAANVTANLTRNVWAHVIIFCGHFPEGAETFTEEQIEGETRGEWYVRQLLGSANIDGGAIFHVLSGNLSHQIEHHLFPDLPSNRYAEIAPEVRTLCTRYGLPYTSGPLTRQYASTWKRILRLALPTRGRRKPAAAPTTRPPQPVIAA
jgi:NADPH-dependent stearoyl-CoA 9-desaturase